MNYLAHFYLADPEPALMFGNFIGDGVKGSDLERFPEEVARGIRFHRHIDHYTDAHDQVMDAKRLFHPTQSKYSGVVVDVLFDHILALQWGEYHKESLADFAERCYDTVREKYELLPQRSERFFHYMAGNDILTHYATRDGIERVLRGMDGRTKFDSNMLQSVNEAERVWDELSGHFERFFPDLVEECKAWKTKH